MSNMDRTYIYADHAATTKLDPQALEAMLPYLTEAYGNPSQRYAFARPARRALREARETVARCIGASPEEIYFTSGGTESDNWAVKGSVCPGGRRRIFTSTIEHHAVLHACAAMERAGCPVVYLPVDAAGGLPPDTLRAAVTPDAGLVSVMLANNEIGTVEPVRELTGIARQAGALFHTDAVQAVGHIPVDVRDLGVDMLSASAHKFGGPKGVGFLYIRSGVELSTFMDGGGQEAGRRAGTENIAAIAGMAAALEASVLRMEENRVHLESLTERFRRRLAASGLDAVLNGAENRIPGSISASFRRAEGEMLLHRLDLKGIAVSTGSACNARSTELSHVLRAIRVPEEYAGGTIRLTFGPENTAEEVDYIVNCLREIIGG